MDKDEEREMIAALEAHYESLSPEEREMIAALEAHYESLSPEEQADIKACVLRVKRACFIKSNKISGVSLEIVYKIGQLLNREADA